MAIEDEEEYKSKELKKEGEKAVTRDITWCYSSSLDSYSYWIFIT